MDDAELRAAAALNVAAMLENQPARMGGRVTRTDRLAVADTGSPVVYVNGATLLEPLSPDRVDEVVAQVEAGFAGPGGGYLLWSAWPTPDLGRYGFTGPALAPLVAGPPGLEPPRRPPRDVEVVEATDAGALAEVERVLARGYRVAALLHAPPGMLYDERVLGGSVRFWLARADGEAVACAASCTAHGVLGFYNVATVPEQRGRGYGTAVTATAIAADPTLPCVAQSSPEGLRVYLAMGLRELAPFTIWTRPARRDGLLARISRGLRSR